MLRRRQDDKQLKIDDGPELLSRSLLRTEHKVLAEEKLQKHIVEMNVRGDVPQTRELLHNNDMGIYIQV